MVKAAAVSSGVLLVGRDIGLDKKSMWRDKGKRGGVEGVEGADGVDRVDEVERERVLSLTPFKPFAPFALFVKAGEGEGRLRRRGRDNIIDNIVTLYGVGGG
jgi:hypothetical protein